MYATSILAKALQAHREADAFFRGLEDDEGGGLGERKLEERIGATSHI